MSGPGSWARAAARALLLDAGPVRVPVVMLHSVAPPRPDRPAAFDLWCPPAMFAGYLRWLKKRGYTTITLHELHAHLAGGVPLPHRPIALTFDDGYLDNWVYAAPLLRRHGMRATVFVPSDFVQPGTSPRPSLDDAWAGRVHERDLDVYGYMNGGELRELAQSGTIDVQSHGRTHTWLPVSGEIVDFHNPGLPLRWLRPLWWNRYPERKPYWFHEVTAEDIAWGVPVYRDDLALAGPAVRPDPALEEHLVAFVAAHGGRAFFDRDLWRAELDAEVERFAARHPLDPTHESPAEFRARLVDELAGSRKALEAITGRPVRFMCWPNGGTCKAAFDLLDECGYLAATLPSRARQPINARGTNPARIGRISATSFFRSTAKTWPWVLSFALKVERNRGNVWAGLPIKAIWLWRRIVPAGGPRPVGAGEAR